MNELFKKLYQILNSVLTGKVFYGSNISDNDDNASMPFIVYNERSKRGIAYADNLAKIRQSIIQVTLVTEKKDIFLEEVLENAFISNDLEYQMVTEFFNLDNSINRVYEIRMEVIENEQ